MNRKLSLGILFGVPAAIAGAYGCVGDSTVTPPDSGADGSVQDATQDQAVDSGSVVQDAGDAGADAAPPGPDSIFGPKLVLWLDADEATTVLTADGGVVTGWNDRSTFANNANVIYANGTSAIKVETKAINGHSAMKLSGTWNATGLFDVPDKTSLQFGPADFVIAMIVAYANTPGQDEYGGRGQLWGKASGGWPWWGAAMAANAYNAPQLDGSVGAPDSVIFGGIKSFADGANSGAWSAKNGWNDGNFHAFTLRKDDANNAVFIRTDGTETSSTQNIDASVGLSGVGTDVQIGGYSSGNTCCYSPLKGYIAEIIVARDTAGTTLELNELTAYIKGKYAIKF